MSAYFPFAQFLPGSLVRAGLTCSRGHRSFALVDGNRHGIDAVGEGEGLQTGVAAVVSNGNCLGPRLVGQPVDQFGRGWACFLLDDPQLNRSKFLTRAWCQENADCTCHIDMKLSEKHSFEAVKHIDFMKS